MKFKKKTRLYNDDCYFLEDLMDNWIQKQSKCNCYDISVSAEIYDNWNKVMYYSIIFEHKDHDVYNDNDFSVTDLLSFANDFTRENIKWVFNNRKERILKEILEQQEICPCFIKHLKNKSFCPVNKRDDK